MKTKLLTVLFGSIWVATTQSGSAALLFGGQPVLFQAFSSFEVGNFQEGSEYQIPSTYGSVLKNGNATVDSGGSNDNGFTNDNVGIGAPPNGIDNFPPMFPTPKVENGYAQIPSGSSVSFLVGNINFSNSLVLAELLFDGAAAVAGQNVAISYKYGVEGNSNPFIPITTTPALWGGIGALGVNGPTGNYDDYVVSLYNLGIILAPGQTIEFMFTGLGNNTAFIDNVALVAVPEPTSVLALGCLLGSGVFLRQRRRTSITLPQTA